MNEELQRFHQRPIGEQVRIIRQRLRLSQSEIGRRLGISQAAVSQMETGGAEYTRGETVRRVAQALGVSELHGGLIPPWIGGQEDW